MCISPKMKCQANYFHLHLELLLINFNDNPFCHNPSFGFTTKTRAYKGASQKWSLKVTFHAPRSVGECEGMNLHIPKWVTILGVRVFMDSRIFEGRLQGSKFIWLKSSLYHWKALKIYMFEMGLHDPFGDLKHKLWPKKRLESSCQFDSRPLKVENRPDFLMYRWCATYR
jgi:hypothetical protein